MLTRGGNAKRVLFLLAAASLHSAQLWCVEGFVAHLPSFVFGRRAALPSYALGRHAASLGHSVPSGRRVASAVVAMQGDSQDPNTTGQWHEKTKSKERPAQGLGNGSGVNRAARRKQSSRLSPYEQWRNAVIEKAFDGLLKMSEPARARALARSKLLPAEERLPSEVVIDVLTGKSKPGTSDLSIPMEARLCAVEDKKRPGAVYKSLSLEPSIENLEEVGDRAASVLDGKMPAWFLNGNTWFGKGRLTPPRVPSHFTVTNRRLELTEAGRNFLDDLDLQVQEDRGVRSRQVRLYFTPKQLKLIPILRRFEYWNSTDPSEKEVEVARILLLGDIKVLDQPPLDEFDDMFYQYLQSEFPDGLEPGYDRDLIAKKFWEDKMFWWKQAFDKNMSWSPHLTILAVSADKQALVERLKNVPARARFNRELKKQAEAINDGILLNGQSQCWPFVTAVMGEGGTGYMNEVDREVEQSKAGLLKTIQAEARRGKTQFDLLREKRRRKEKSLRQMAKARKQTERSRKRKR